MHHEKFDTFHAFSRFPEHNQTSSSADVQNASVTNHTSLSADGLNARDDPTLKAMPRIAGAVFIRIAPRRAWMPIIVVPKGVCHRLKW